MKASVFSTIFTPFFDYISCNIKYDTINKSPGKIFIDNPATGTKNQLHRVEPTVAKCTLGVILSLNASSKTQMKYTIDLAREYTGKLKNIKLHATAKWTALSTVLAPKMPL
jgi:hypothetical protein